MAVSKSKRLGLLNKQDSDQRRQDRESQLSVPNNLQRLLGSSVSLNPAVYRNNRATVMAGGEVGAVFSNTGQLPVSQSSLENMRSFYKPKQELKPKAPAAINAAAPTAPTTASSTTRRKTRDDVKDNQVEYERYLVSPFSFIDKVIESPYTEEFVYLVPKGPYDLEIVKHDQIDPNNYYTMSRAGVTHFFPDRDRFHVARPVGARILPVHQDDGHPLL
jgi:hypothetical protein